MTKFSTDYQPTHDRSEARKEAASITRALKRIVASPDMKFGTNDKVTIADRIARKLAERAVKGDLHAIEMTMTRVDGKPVDRQAITDSGGEDVELDPRTFTTILLSNAAEAGLTPDDVLLLLSRSRPKAFKP